MIISNHIKTLLISFGVFVLISILSWLTIFYHESATISFLLEIFVGGGISILVYMKMIRVVAEKDPGFLAKSMEEKLIILRFYQLTK